MITIRTNPYTQEDFLFVNQVLHTGLSHSCFNFAYNTDAEMCNNCKQKISCKELQSAMHFVLAKIYRIEAQTSNQENKTL
ncbi:MAG: hypothetical protein J6S67_12925 [Methanobrevibacter sp.]|nr:hypothetical protein [Methanobrevibacter sp.]